METEKTINETIIETVNKTENKPIKKIKKTDNINYMKDYMREYKRKQYEVNSENIKEKNKAYYYKYKFGCSDEEMKKYDVLLPIIMKTKNNLDLLKLRKPELLAEILQIYL